MEEMSYAERFQILAVMPEHGSLAARAELAGLGEGKVKAFYRVRRDAEPEILEEVLQGTVSIYHAEDVRLLPRGLQLMILMHSQAQGIHLRRAYRELWLESGGSPENISSSGTLKWKSQDLPPLWVEVFGKWWED